MNLVRRTVVGKGIKVRLGQVENMIWLALSESSTTNEGKNSLIRQIKLEGEGRSQIMLGLALRNL